MMIVGCWVQGIRQMEMLLVEIENIGCELCMVEEDGGERQGSTSFFKIVLLKCLGVIKQEMLSWQLDVQV